MMRVMSPDETAARQRDLRQRRIMMSTPARHRFDQILQLIGELPEGDLPTFYAPLADAAFNPQAYDLPEAP